MDKSLKWRIVVVALVFLTAIYFALPSVVGTGNLPSWWTQKKISLGLDLKGGIHLVMGADLNVVLENTVARRADDFHRVLFEKSVTVSNVENQGPMSIKFQFPDQESLAKAEKFLEKDFPTITVSSTSGSSMVITLKSSEITSIKELTGRQALETIRNRVDLFGVAEPDIRPQGEDRIVIQLPGMDDPKRAVELIGKTALLEFKLVDDAHTAEWALKNGLPVGMEILYGREKDSAGNVVEIPYLLKKQPLMTGESLVDARVSQGQFGEPEVAIEFDSSGARQFERITGQYVQRSMAIVLDNVVYSAPNIRNKISGGRAVITGSKNIEEARDLAVALRAGALPAPVSVLEERTVGPTLGSDSIVQGFQAGILGLGLILVFMLVYYRLSGFVADMALIMNLPIILAILATFGATLTLPGIFGLILTLGMAVDANVLVFERIREELRIGKTPKAAVEAGFSRAFATIFDSNFTTLLITMILYQFGSGPIRGFAVTLSVGVLSSMFTAVFFSRVVFDCALSSRRVEKLSI